MRQLHSNGSSNAFISVFARVVVPIVVVLLGSGLLPAVLSTPAQATTKDHKSAQQSPDQVRQAKLAALAPKKAEPGDPKPDPKKKSMQDNGSVTPAPRTSAFAAASVSPGSIDSGGPLTHIGTTTDLNCSLNHTGDTAGEFYGNTACGTFIVIDGTLYGPQTIPAGGGAAPRTALTPVSQSGSGTGTVSDPYKLITVADAGITGVRLTQTDTYVVGQESYRTDVAISNNAAAAKTYRLYRAFDCFRADSDIGYGTASTASGTVGCVSTANIPSPLLQISPITQGSAFYEASYSQVWAKIGAQQAFDNTCRCNESIDNGAGLSWSSSINAGATTTVSSRIEASLGTPVEGPVVPAESYGSGNGSSNLQQCNYTNYPVNCATGNFWHEFPDIKIPGRGGGLGVARTYNSLDAANDSEFGYGWSSNIGTSLTILGGQVTVNQENGAVAVLNNDGAGNFVAPPRILASLTHNGDGSWTFVRRQRDTFNFDATGQLTSQRDRNGYVTTYTRPNINTLVATDPAGRALTFAYTSGHINGLTDPGGRTMSFSYDVNGNLTDVIDVGGGHWTFTYDGNHHMVTMREPKYFGDTTTTPTPEVRNVYDSQGRVTSQTDQLGRVTTFSYGADGTNVITDPKGNVENQRYVQGELVSVTKGVGTASAAIWTYTYDQATLGVATETDPNGRVKSYQYDVNGNTVSTTDALGHTTSATFNAQNDLLSKTDALGNTTNFTYDTAGNVLTRDEPLVAGASPQRAVTTLVYGDSAHLGDVTSSAGPNGQKTTLTYDSYGDVTSVIDPAGNKATLFYPSPSIGNVTSTVAPKGNVPGGTPSQFTTTIAYDAFNRVTSKKDPLWSAAAPSVHQTATTYDANGNITSSTDGQGAVTTYQYDAANQLTATYRPDGTTLGSQYWPDGTLKAQVDGAGRSTSYDYDPLGHLASLTDPLNRTMNFTNDAVGNLLKKTDPGGTCTGTPVGCTTNSYDAANRITAITYSDGVTPNVSYAYDDVNRRTSMTDGTGTTTSTHDAGGRLTSQTNGAGATVGYAYDTSSRMTSLTYPGNKTVARAFDAANRLTAVTDWLGKTNRFTYDPNSNLTSQLSANGVAEANTYDRTDQMTGVSINKSTAANFTYGRDGNGSLTSTTSTGVAPGTETYNYDQGNRLTKVNSQNLTYDPADNLTTTPNNSTQAYDTGNEVTSKVSAGVTTNYTYDTRGNRTSAGTVTYGYDQMNRLKTVSGPTAASYAYDGDGARTQKTVGSTTNAFVYNNAEDVSQILSDGTNSYIYGPGGMPVEQVANDNTVTYLHHDQLGSVRLLTNDSRAVVGTYTYDAYGATTAKTGAATTPMRYAGQYADDESGLYWMRARYYDASTGQFISRDPVVSLTRSPYAYAGGNPLNATDPGGLWWGSDAAKAVGGYIYEHSEGLSQIAAGASIASYAVCGLALQPEFCAIGAGLGYVSTGLSGVTAYRECSRNGIVSQQCAVAGTDFGLSLAGTFVPPAMALRGEHFAERALLRNEARWNIGVAGANFGTDWLVGRAADRSFAC